MLLDGELLKEIDEGLAHDEPPDVLWHYTSVPGARDILESRSLRLCCHAFMNDPAEGTVAGSIVSESWAAVVDASPSHPRLDLSYIRDTTAVLSYFDFGRPELPPTFLFSLTELRDSLSQWSRYGDNGAGIALGFAIRASELPPASKKPWTTGTELVRVDYDGAETHPSSKVRPLIARLLTKYLPRFRDPTEVENTLIALAHRLNPMVKRGAYFEEREWRIITRVVLESDELYEIGCNRYGIAPYVPLPLSRGVTLVELMLGPKLSPENAWSANWLCKKFDQAPRISRSTLAYR
jgi:hypothetical protein